LLLVAVRMHRRFKIYGNGLSQGKPVMIKRATSEKVSFSPGHKAENKMRTHLKLCVVEFVTVHKEELIGGLLAGFNAVTHYCTCARRAR